MTSSVTLRRDETTQSFKLGCVIATKLGALVSPPPPPHPCWSCPPGIPSPTGGNWCVSVRLCSCRTGPGSDSCASPERTRRSRRRVPLQPYLLFLRPLLFHPVLKLQLSSHNSSREAGKHTTSSRKKTSQAAVAAFIQGRAARSSALRRGAFPGKKVNPECVCAMFPRPIFSTQRNFCPVRGGDPVGSMAAACSRVSVTAGDIRGELSYLMDRLCYWFTHWFTHWITHWITLEAVISPPQSCDDEHKVYSQKSLPFWINMSLIKMQLSLESTLSRYIIKFPIKFVTFHGRHYIALWRWDAVK